MKFFVKKSILWYNKRLRYVNKGNNMTEKEAIIIKEIYLIENALEIKMLNTYLNKYYGGKALEELQPFQQNKILSWMQSRVEDEEMNDDRISSWALEHGYF